MKPDELKLRISTYAEDLIDKMFPQQELFSRLKGATAKYWIRQNLWKLDAILENFVDCNGCIDTDDAISFYSDEIFDENGQFSVSIKDIITNQEVSKFLPNKIVVFTKDDLKHLMGSEHDSTYMHAGSDWSNR